MRRIPGAHGLLAGGGALLWLVLLLVPLGTLAVAAVGADVDMGRYWPLGKAAALTARSLALAAAIAAVSVALGYVPGRVLGTARRGGTLLFCLVVAPLLLPRYVLFYVWSLLLTPTTPLGRLLAEQPQSVAVRIGEVTSSAVLVLWYWPLAALILAQGWRNLDAEVLAAARLEAGPASRFRRVILPLLGGPLALAFAVSFVLVLLEYGTFHLAGVRTVGSELGVLYEQTGSTAVVARAAWPLVVVAAAVAALVSRRLKDLSADAPLDRPTPPAGPARWAVFAALMGASLAAPLAILASSVRDLSGLGQFWRLQSDGLANSLASAVVAAALALAMAAGALACEGLGARGRRLARVMQFTILLAALLPGALVGAAILETQVALGPAPTGRAAGVLLVAAGQAVRFAGVALVVLMLARGGSARHYREMAGVDGAGPVDAWRHVHLPLVWPLVLGAGVVVAMFSLTELPATMLLLPPGLANFTQRLLNQMHYARDQHVIASCLLLAAVYLGLAVLVAALRGLASARSARVLLVAAASLGALGLGGCESGASDAGEPDVLAIIGRTGGGPGEFLYPRAIDLAADGTLWVADKSGRIQHLSAAGEEMLTLRMPLIEKGKPVGISLGPDGNLYVADTHYHRVMVFAPDGTVVREFGSFGTGDGQFVYPTDVAFAPDGRLFVSEYGGNDRVSLWTPEGRFLGSFGRPGSGEGEFARPAALAVDARRGVLYVADACNHRVAKYTFDGVLTGYMGDLGQEPGRLRYPYGLALQADGTLLVSEYGNNRLQKFAPDGRSLGCLGRAGRAPGRLACPWGVAADARGRVYVVDAGNNRVQVWRW